MAAEVASSSLSAQHAVSPEPLSPLLSPRSPKPTDPMQLAAAIRKQVEFYFSDVNLPTDKHLLKQISKDPDGYVPLKMIANFKRVKGLTKDLSVVTEALKGSTLLSVDEEGSRVRRTTPLPAFDVSDICRRTVVAEHLPGKPTIESVTQLFTQYGEVIMVRICSRGSNNKLPAWLNKAVEAINVNLGHGEFALVEFGSEDDCISCVSKTKNPDNWRTSLRVRHLLPNFKPVSKGGRRTSDQGGSHDGSQGGAHHHHPHPQQQHSKQQTSSSRESSSGGAAAAAASQRPPQSRGTGRTSMELLQPPQQHGSELGSATAADSGSQPATADDASAGSNASAAAAAAAAAAAGLPMHLTPIRTQLASSGGSQPASVTPSRLQHGQPGSPVAGVSSPVRAAGVGGSIGSPRVARSPAPPDVANLIDSILSAPTGSTPTRGSSSGRWSSGASAAERDWGGGTVTSPAAAVAAALAGVMTPPQSGSPRHSTSSSSAGTRLSQPGGGTLGTPTRLSGAGSAAAGASSSSASHSPVQGALAAQLAAQAAAAAASALTGSPKASSSPSWRSSGGTRADGQSLSAPGTPGGSAAGGSMLSISAGAAIAAALEAASPPAGGTGAFTVGSPDLMSTSGGGASKPGPWIPASRLAHHQRMPAAHATSDGGAAEGSGSWRSGGNWSGLGVSPPKGVRPPKPRSNAASSGGGSNSDGRQRRRSWHLTDADEAAAGSSSHAADAFAVVAGTSPADGCSSDGGNAPQKPGRQSSRLGHAGDYHATIEAIREASCELDNGAVGRAIAALNSSSGSKPGGRRSSSGGGPADAHDDEGEGEHGSRRRRTRHRRSRSSGSRRTSLDDARPGLEHPASAGVTAVGLSPRGFSRGGALAPDSHQDSHHHHHHGQQQHHQQRSSGGGSHGHSHGHDTSSLQKKGKKDYASWAAATPEFRAAAAAAKHSSGGGAAAAGSGAMLGTSPGGHGGLSPMRDSSSPGAALHHAGDGPVRLARMPDGTRGFSMGRGRPITPPGP